MGGYLANRSPVVAGSACSVAVIPARGDPGTGGSIADYDILDASPPNELLRVLNGMWPEDAVFLPLDDPVFTKESVLVNFENTVEWCSIGTVYDAVLLLPVAHWKPPPGAMR